jgi:hypothetical protein
LQLAHDERDQLNHVNAATILTQLAHTQHQIVAHAHFRQLLQALAVTCEQRGLRWLPVRETAYVVHSLGRLLGPGPAGNGGPTTTTHSDELNDTVRRILHWITSENTTTQEVANLAHGLDYGHRSEGTDSRWWKKFDSQISPKREVLKAKLLERFFKKSDDDRCDSDATRRYCWARAPWLLQHGTTQEISNIVWAMAKLGYNNQKNNNKHNNNMLC